MKKNGITLRAFLFGALFAAVFAALTVYIENAHNICITSVQIAVLPYVLLILTVLLINPLCRLMRVIRVFSPVEILVIFVMGMVSAGLSTFGLSSQLVPVTGSLFNSEWNNKQLEWNEYVVPYLNEKYFVAEPGIQAAAVEYRREMDRELEKKSVYDAASILAEYAKQAASLEVELAGIKQKNPAQSAKIELALGKIRRLHSDSLEQWNDLRKRRPDLPEWKEVLSLYPREIDRQEALTDEAEKKLIALEEKAFAKVAVFRRGLPRDERSFPGILPLSGDDRRAYFGRLHRLVGGLGALRQVKLSWTSARALPPEAAVGADLAATYSDTLARTAKELASLCDNAELNKLKDKLDARDRELTARRMDLAARLKAISERKTGADRALSFELDSQTDSIIGELKSLDGEYKSFKGDLELCHRELDCARNVQVLVDKISDLEKKLSAGGLRGGALADSLAGLIPSFASIDVSLRRYFLGQIPWHFWVKPLARWGFLIGLTYIVLMALNVLIFRQWAHNERLTYPLAELSKILIGEPDSTGLPAVYRNGLFWIGAAISMAVLGWNLLCSTQIVPGLTPFDLQNTWTDYVDKTQFQALRNIRTEIFFTMIGLSFLVPKNISFSLWFFYIVYMLQLLVMVWSGYGTDDRSFPWDWWYLTNFRNAQGQGALLVFSGLVLYKCRRYILCALFSSSVADLEQSERTELRFSSFAFLVCSFGLIMMLWLSMGANLYYTILFYVVVLVITIGLIRAVAEGGLLGFQANASPIHYLLNFFGLNRSWTSAALYAPLMVYYAMLFLDIKTCIAPAFANALKLREDFRLKRFSFHAAIVLAVVCAACVAVVTALMMCYDRGGDNMQSWFYTGLPKGSLFEVIKSTIKDAPAANLGNAAWTVSGGVVMGLLLFLRQFYFWMPHPIGLIMFVNPIMGAYWFSIFLGWIFNVAVTKYGNKDTFHRAKGFFIGLIMGELLMVVLSFIVAITTGSESGISLNR